MVRRLVFVVGLTLLAGCATRPPVSAPPASRPAPAPVRPPAPALAPADYVARIASIELFAARAAALGLERIADPAIRNRLEVIAHDHRGVSAQLRMAGQRLNLLPAPVLLPEQQRQWALLDRGQPFEVSLQRRLLQAHQEAVELHRAFAAGGSSPTLRQFARFALETERGHLPLVQPTGLSAR